MGTNTPPHPPAATPPLPAESASSTLASLVRELGLAWQKLSLYQEGYPLRGGPPPVHSAPVSRVLNGGSTRGGTRTTVIVFVDEIDQAFGQRGGPSGDGGVDQRIFGRLLEFMSDTDHRGKILWIGASNFPDRIDPAMKRAGRMDLVLPFLLPDAESRRQIFKVILEHKLDGVTSVQHRLGDADFEELARCNLAALMKGTRMVGPGLRDAIWVQGCSLLCPGCANQAYLAPSATRPSTGAAPATNARCAFRIASLRPAWHHRPPTAKSC